VTQTKDLVYIQCMCIFEQKSLEIAIMPTNYSGMYFLFNIFFFKQCVSQTEDIAQWYSTSLASTRPWVWSPSPPRKKKKRKEDRECVS
jgi:hypothetical protein